MLNSCVSISLCSVRITKWGKTLASVTLTLSYLASLCCRKQFNFKVWWRNIKKRQSYSHSFSFIKLMKRKALRKQSLHEKTAASVLLKLFHDRWDGQTNRFLCNAIMAFSSKTVTHRQRDDKCDLHQWQPRNRSPRTQGCWDPLCSETVWMRAGWEG